MNRSSLIRMAVNSVLCDGFETKTAGGAGGTGEATTQDRLQSVRQVANLADAEAAIKQIHGDISAFVTRAAGEMSEQGRVSRETAAAMTKASEELEIARKRLDTLEAKYDRQGEGQAAAQSLGKIFIGNEGYTSMQKNKSQMRSRVDVKSLLGNMETRAIVNATGQNQPLVPQMNVPGVFTPVTRRLTIRDLIPVGRTSSNLVQYVKELLYTNNAGPQTSGSPTLGAENATKPESRRW